MVFCQLFFVYIFRTEQPHKEIYHAACSKNTQEAQTKPAPCAVEKAGGKLDPNGNASRAEAAVMLYRFMKLSPNGEQQ